MIIVTGASGQLGKATVERLLERREPAGRVAEVDPTLARLIGRSPVRFRDFLATVVSPTR